jgi:hypothetical protein
VDHVKVDMLARDLVRLLQDLLGLHTELAGHLREKLEAVRRADANRIQTIAARQAALVARGAEREGLRRQLTRKLVEALGQSGIKSEEPEGAEASRVKLTTLAEHLPEPRRSQLLGVAAGLRSVLEEIERLRAVDRRVTEEMLRHLGEVFAVITGGKIVSDTYSRQGHREGVKGANVFEAVG